MIYLTRDELIKIRLIDWELMQSEIDLFQESQIQAGIKFNLI